MYGQWIPNWVLVHDLISFHRVSLYPLKHPRPQYCKSSECPPVKSAVPVIKHGKQMWSCATGCLISCAKRTQVSYTPEEVTRGMVLTSCSGTEHWAVSGSRATDEGRP